jgi:MFS family permease
VLGGALWLDALDVSMVGVALPSIRTALDLSTSSLQWIVSGYVLGYGGLLLLGGRAADLLGPWCCRRCSWSGWRSASASRR